MPGSRYSKLNEAQRETLRLFHAHLQIKEIADTLGIAESTVNHRLAQSRSILGFPSSRAAARWMAEHEQDLGLRSKTTKSFSSMANAPHAASSGAVDTMDRPHGAGDPEREQVADIPGDFAPHGLSRFPWPFPTAGRKENDLSWKTRLALVFPVAIILLICVMTLIVLGLGFQELLVSFEAWVGRLP